MCVLDFHMKTKSSPAPMPPNSARRRRLHRRHGPRPPRRRCAGSRHGLDQHLQPLPVEIPNPFAASNNPASAARIHWPRSTTYRAEDGLCGDGQVRGAVLMMVRAIPLTGRHPGPDPDPAARRPSREEAYSLKSPSASRRGLAGCRIKSGMTEEFAWPPHVFSPLVEEMAGRPEGVFSAQTTRSSRSTFSATAIRFQHIHRTSSSCRSRYRTDAAAKFRRCGEFRHGHAAVLRKTRTEFSHSRGPPRSPTATFPRPPEHRENRLSLQPSTMSSKSSR